MRDFHFMKIDHEALATANLEAEPEAHYLEAKRRFYAMYQLPEFGSQQLPQLLVDDLAELFATELPRWILGQLTPDEIAVGN